MYTLLRISSTLGQMFCTNLYYEAFMSIYFSVTLTLGILLVLPIEQVTDHDISYMQPRTSFIICELHTPHKF